MNSAELIEAVRKRAGLSRADLADKIGTTRDHIYRWERYGVSPSVDRLIQILEACNHEMIVRRKDEAYYGRRNPRLPKKVVDRG